MIVLSSHYNIIWLIYNINDGFVMILIFLNHITKDVIKYIYIYFLKNISHVSYRKCILFLSGNNEFRVYCNNILKEK